MGGALAAPLARQRSPERRLSGLVPYRPQTRQACRWRAATRHGAPPPAPRPPQHRFPSEDAVGSHHQRQV